MAVYPALTIHRNVHPIEKMPEQWHFSELSLPHCVEINGNCYVNQHDIKVGSVIRTKDISLIFVDFSPFFNRIEDQNRPKDQVGPDFL